MSESARLTVAIVPDKADAAAESHEAPADSVFAAAA